MNQSQNYSRWMYESSCTMAYSWVFQHSSVFHNAEQSCSWCNLQIKCLKTVKKSVWSVFFFFSSSLLFSSWLLISYSIAYIQVRNGSAQLTSGQRLRSFFRNRHSPQQLEKSRWYFFNSRNSELPTKPISRHVGCTCTVNHKGSNYK